MGEIVPVFIRSEGNITGSDDVGRRVKSEIKQAIEPTVLPKCESNHVYDVLIMGHGPRKQKMKYDVLSSLLQDHHHTLYKRYNGI